MRAVIRQWALRAVDSARRNRLLTGAIAAGLAARIVFWAMTDRRFEDALITIKHAKNAANGVGLVHHLGEGHVHGFTSALSVLIPLPGELVSDGGGFLLIRLVSLIAFVLTAIYAYRIGRELRLGSWPIGLVLAYLALDENQIFYGMAGMETQIAVAILLAGIYYVLTEDFTKSGIALGLAPLVRPDFLLWLGPAYLFLIVRDRRRALGAGLISGWILLPWLIFATLYYGSPVPHTIVAKSAVFGPDFPPLTQIWSWIKFVGSQLNDHRHDWSVVAPFAERTFVKATPVPIALLKALSWSIGLLAVLGAAATWRRAAWRPAIAFVMLFVLYKVFFVEIGYFEWYYPPVMAVIMLLAAAGLTRLTAPAPRLVPISAVALASLYAIQAPFFFPLDARIQHDIEDKVRKPLGQYLARVVKPGQTISSESSGYVGFYTNATLYDYPGLTSPTVVDALRASGPGFYSPAGVAAALHPDWLVLRPSELSMLRQSFPESARLYRRVRTFSVGYRRTKLDQWGLTMRNGDRRFIVLRRKGPTGPA